MATIEQLVPSILTLNRAEQLALVKRNRLNRRTHKFAKKKAARKTSGRKSATVKATPKELFAQMTSTQREAILKELLGD